MHNQQALAAAIGRKPATIRWWINGSAARAPETIAEDAVPVVLAVFAAALPDLDPAQIPSLLRGPMEDLELLLDTGAVPSLMRLVENEAQRDVGELIPARRARRDLIELSEPPERPSDAVIQRGHDFRIAFRTRGRGRFVVALQSAPSGWGVVPCSLDGDAGMIHLPGLIKGGLTYMKERVETGRHVFVAA
ncbi:MAG: hypothetical protein NXH97_21050 [Rhodobacteraceae bacterium]|nr:hypothetical protein [Paracoccaceae bacterium]